MLVNFSFITPIWPFQQRYDLNKCTKELGLFTVSVTPLHLQDQSFQFIREFLESVPQSLSPHATSTFIDSVFEILFSVFSSLHVSKLHCPLYVLLFTLCKTDAQCLCEEWMGV